MRWGKFGRFADLHPPRLGVWALARATLIGALSERPHVLIEWPLPPLGPVQTVGPLGSGASPQWKTHTCARGASASTSRMPVLMLRRFAGAVRVLSCRTASPALSAHTRQTPWTDFPAWRSFPTLLSSCYDHGGNAHAPFWLRWLPSVADLSDSLGLPYARFLSGCPCRLPGIARPLASQTPWVAAARRLIRGSARAR